MEASIYQQSEKFIEIKKDNMVYRLTYAGDGKITTARLVDDNFLELDILFNYRGVRNFEGTTTVEVDFIDDAYYEVPYGHEETVNVTKQENYETINVIKQENYEIINGIYRSLTLELDYTNRLLNEEGSNKDTLIEVLEDIDYEYVSYDYEAESGNDIDESAIDFETINFDCGLFEPDISITFTNYFDVDNFSFHIVTDEMAAIDDKVENELVNLLFQMRPELPNDKSKETAEVFIESIFDFCMTSRYYIRLSNIYALNAWKDITSGISYDKQQLLRGYIDTFYEKTLLPLKKNETVD